MILASLREDLRPVLLRLLQRNAGSLGFCSQLVRQAGTQTLGACQAAACSQHLPSWRQPWTGCTHGLSCQSAAHHPHCSECIHLPARTHSQDQQLLSFRRSPDLIGSVQCAHQPANRAAGTCQPLLLQPCSPSSAAPHTKPNLSTSITPTFFQAYLTSIWINFSRGRGTGTTSGPHGIRVPDSSPLRLIQGQGSPIRSSSSSSSTLAEAEAHKKRRRQTLPTWLHILRRKRHAREKGRATAAVVRRAKRDGIMASPKGIRATSLTALRAAPVWPSVDIPTDFGEPAAPNNSAASPWTDTAASDPEAFSSGSSRGHSHGRSKAPEFASAGTHMSAGAHPADAIDSSSWAEAKSSGSYSPVRGARSSVKRASQGRGGSASGRVWPMDPPELTEAISRCASLKGLAQILDVTEDMASGGSPESTGLPDRQQVFTPGLRLQAARLALQREMRALSAEREGRTRRPGRPSSSMPIILTAAFNQLAWLHTHSGPQPEQRPRASALAARNQEHALQQALLRWMFDQLSVVMPVLDARGASTIVGALGALRQSPPPETWASLVDRLLEPLPTTDISRGFGKAGRGSDNQPGPKTGHRTLVEDMDVAQLVDLSAGLARLRAENSQLWTAILEAAAVAAARQEIAPSQLALLLQNVKRGCGGTGASVAKRIRSGDIDHHDEDDARSHHDEDDAHPSPWTHTDKHSHNEPYSATNSPHSPGAHMELQRHKTLLTLVAALPSVLPRMELKDIATTVAALRGLHLSLDPDALHLLNHRVAFLLVRRQEQRKQQADHARLQQRLKEIAAGVLRGRAGDRQEEVSLQKSSSSTSMSMSSEESRIIKSRGDDNKGNTREVMIAAETEGDRADARAVRMLCRHLAAWQAGDSKLWGLLRRG